MAHVTQTVGAPPDAAAMEHVFQLVGGYMVSAALGVVAQLGVADQLADGPRPVVELARRVGADEDALYRVLRALSVVGVFTETSPRTFALTPAGTLLRADVPGSARDMVVWLCDAFHFRVYAEMITRCGRESRWGSAWSACRCSSISNVILICRRGSTRR